MMWKLKTKRGSYKRFKFSSGLRFKHKQSHLRHLLVRKSSKRKRQLGKLKYICRSDFNHVKSRLPYFKK